VGRAPSDGRPRSSADDDEQEEAQKAAKLLALTDDEMALLQVVPMRARWTAPSRSTAIYRFHELVAVYGRRGRS